jgi:hypothetical protein
MVKRLDGNSPHTGRSGPEFVELSLEFCIFALKPTEMLGKTLFGLPPLNRCLEVVQVHDGADTDIKAWSIIVEETPRFQDVSFSYRGSNSTDFQCAGLEALASRSFFGIVEYGLNI